MNSKRSNWRIKAGLVFPFLLILVLAAAQWSALHSQSETNEIKSAQNKNRKLSKLNPDTVPVVDYNASQATDSGRQKKNRRHGGVSGFVDKSYKGGESVLTNDWEVGLPALPVDRSDAILIGRVIDAQAYLTDDKTSIYSEFKVVIDKTLKGDEQALSPGTPIIAERLGGRLRLPSGRTNVYRVIGQAFPQLNGRYVFFLKRENAEGDYSILTAYELKGGRIVPLDGSSIELTSAWQFDKYKDVDEQQFLNELQELIVRSSGSNQGGR